MRGMQGVEWEYEDSAWVCGESKWKCRECAESVWQCTESSWKPRYNSSENDIAKIIN